MFNKIKKVLASGLVGLALAYNISCGSNDDLRIINLENTQPIIVTQTLEDAIAGEYYEKQIELYDPDNTPLHLSLVNGPKGMILEKNRINNQDIYTLNWSPPHSKIGPNFSQTGNFKVELSVTDTIANTTKTLDLFVKENTTSLDYLRTDENIRFVCEAPCIVPRCSDGFDNDSDGLIDLNDPGCFTNNVYDRKDNDETDPLAVPDPNQLLVTIKSDSLDEFSEGLYNSIELLKNTVKSDVPEALKKVDYHIIIDSECNGRGTWTSYASDGRRLICDTYRQIDISGKILPFGNGVADLKDIRNFSRSIHEYTHDILNNKPYYSHSIGQDGGKKFQESLASISTPLTEASGYAPGLNSFCNWSNWNIVVNRDYSVVNNLCEYYGFDIKDLPAFFDEIEPLAAADVKDIKCIMDRIITRNKGVETNTWRAFFDSNILEIIDYDYYCGN